MCNVIQNTLTERLLEGLRLSLSVTEVLSVQEDLLFITEDVRLVR